MSTFAERFAECMDSAVQWAQRVALAGSTIILDRYATMVHHNYYAQNPASVNLHDRTAQYTQLFNDARNYTSAAFDAAISAWASSMSRDMSIIDAIMYYVPEPTRCVDYYECNHTASVHYYDGCALREMGLCNCTLAYGRAHDRIGEMIREQGYMI